MNPTYVRIELFRQSRDIGNLMFMVLMPMVMYLLFGNTFGGGDQPAGNGNVKFYVMASMAAYGAALATTSIAGTAATESMLGWGRQIALTRMKPSGFVASKLAVALIVATGSAGLVFAVGAGTGARADTPWIWTASFLVCAFGSGIFALYGMGVGMAFKSETALGVASGGMVFFAFFGNVFMPLSGTMLDIARFTPMYGYAGLVRYPLTEGFGAGEGAAADSVGVLVANAVAWTLLFALLALWAVRRSRMRQ
ncbi:ABC transporter permease [Paeniglutamicibacter psychrophenolicus]|uniref:ABC-2 type transport system permease protein n=1 Tax=Paeniglutamicibacter psychrophenolicus TaxID=257454 RepID=A0ABS4WAJ9_9MICC|nr:ABC transporter permease [Paeniglutamicibacter psychrophenolicus]MBP2373234.1 ABC-2 type transport system permease protein [Paeniglutamicibacter psychrophenolicus]